MPSCRSRQPLGKGDAGTMPEVTRSAAVPPGVALLRTPQEIDICNTRAVVHQLDQASERGVRTIVVDMSLTSFCDSSGVRAIAKAHGHARSKGIELRLVVRSAQVKRLFEITNLDTLVHIYPDASAALADA